MASVNRMIVLGNCGKDPEVRYMSNGTAVTNLSVATTRTWKDKAGDKMEETEWHRLVFYDRLAEIVGEYVKKGDPIFVEGRLKTRKWEKNGVDHYTTEIIAENMQLMGSRREDSGERTQQQRRSAPAPAPRPSQPKTQTGFDDMDDDIPF